MCIHVVHRSLPTFIEMDMQTIGYVSGTLDPVLYTSPVVVTVAINF